MKKNLLTIISSLILITNLFSQKKINLEVTFKDGKIINGEFNVNVLEIFNEDTNQSYSLDSIKNMIIDKKDPRFDAYVINAKSFVDSKHID